MFCFGCKTILYGGLDTFGPVHQPLCAQCWYHPQTRVLEETCSECDGDGGFPHDCDCDHCEVTIECKKCLGHGVVTLEQSLTRERYEFNTRDVMAWNASVMLPKESAHV